MKKTIYTKEHIKTIASMWPGNPNEAIKEKLGFSQHQFGYLTAMMRKQGFRLKKKTGISPLTMLIRDTLKELKGR